MDTRALYVAVLRLAVAHRDDERTLAEFLRALRVALAPHYGRPVLAAEAFVEAVTAAFTGPAPAPEPGWRREHFKDDGQGPADAARVDRILKSQALDLEDAEASGAARDEYRFFGRAVDRADGVVRATDDHYVNWSPSSYVECGIAGAFGGWEPGDDTGRELVPGHVAVPTGDGIRSVPAAELERPVFEVGELAWAQVADFLWCGQHYE